MGKKCGIFSLLLGLERARFFKWVLFLEPALNGIWKEEFFWKLNPPWIKNNIWWEDVEGVNYSVKVLKGCWVYYFNSSGMMNRAIPDDWTSNFFFGERERGRHFRIVAYKILILWHKIWEQFVTLKKKFQGLHFCCLTLPITDV